MRLMIFCMSTYWVTLSLPLAKKNGVKGKNPFFLIFRDFGKTLKKSKSRIFFRLMICGMSTHCLNPLPPFPPKKIPLIEIRGQINYLYLKLFLSDTCLICQGGNLFNSKPENIRQQQYHLISS